jgi:hypothetical protein
MGRIKPKTVSELMGVANRFADREDACNNKRTRSPEDDRRNRYGSQRRRSRNYDNHGYHSQVAMGYKDNNYKEASAEAQDIKAMERRTIKSFPQENPESTIHRQKTCSTDPVIYTQRSSMESMYPGTQ